MEAEKRIWYDIRLRCHNKNNTSYESNGAKGIRMCDRWLNSYDNFLSDMGEKPFKEAVMGRIDKSGGFTPENCKWMTMKESQLGKSNMVLNWELVNGMRSLYKNTDMTIKQIAEKLDCNSLAAVKHAIQGNTWKTSDYKYVKRPIGGKCCKVEGCIHKHHSKGFCILHKSRWLSHGDPLWTPPEKQKICKEKDCKKPYFSKGYCRNHYEQVRRHGKVSSSGNNYQSHKCMVEGCDGEIRGKKLCIKHYTRLIRTGMTSLRELNKSELPEYRIWGAMVQRCTNPNNSHYKRYGGRRITICKQWKEDFDNFYRDMGPRPTSKHQIDRENNSKGYNKDNCRWVLAKDNMRNRDINVLNPEIVAEIRKQRESGDTYKTISDHLKISYSNVRSVLSRGAWE